MRPVGGFYENGKCSFTVWAPERERMTLHIVSPRDLKVEMQKDVQGYFTAEVAEVAPGYRYFYIPDDDKGYPDPASFYQPDGVHGPSEIVDHHSFIWSDGNWKGLPMRDLIIYELHVGTFSPDGTFEGVIPYLDDLIDTGINAIEIMPISQFPGGRNWGYDGVFPYTAQNTYGGTEGLKKLVDACHQRGIAVYLDVVYNHLGPDGNYLSVYAPYFSGKYKTPWGQAVNFDDEYSDGVREYFVGNAIYWMKYFHIDGLRLDAIHQMYDFGATHFWEMLHYKVKTESQKLGRHFYLIAESDLNNPKVVKSPEAGGYGFDAQWLDDFHHALFTLLYQDGIANFIDFGRVEHLAKAYKEGFVHAGEFVKFRKRKYGASTAGLPGDRFIIFNQNHDQIGNSADGGRLATKISFDQQKVASAILLLAPYIPMMFMGEEYGEDNPFAYFISHTDKELVEAVRKGRKEEFKNFDWGKEFFDPQDASTFEASKISWEKRKSGKYNILLRWTKALIALRKGNSAMQNYKKDDLHIQIITSLCFGMYRRSEDGQQHLLAIYNLSGDTVPYAPLSYASIWNLVLNSNDYQEDKNLMPEGLAKEIMGEQPIDIPPFGVLVYTGTNKN